MPAISAARRVRASRAASRGSPAAIALRSWAWKLVALAFAPSAAKANRTLAAARVLATATRSFQLEFRSTSTLSGSSCSSAGLRR